jgi:hypothetical protein
MYRTPSHTAAGAEKTQEKAYYFSNVCDNAHRIIKATHALLKKMQYHIEHRCKLQKNDNIGCDRLI